MEHNQDSYNKGGFIAFMFSIVFCLVFFIYLVFFHPKMQVDQIAEPTPAGAEQTTADNGAAAAPKDVDISNIAKPWEENPDMVAHGSVLFHQNCAICHGPKGLGDGPAGKTLVPPPRNFVEGKWKKGGTSIGIFGVITNGLEGSSMASFAHIPVRDRWALVQFIRSITHNKVPDNKAALEKFGQSTLK